MTEPARIREKQQQRGKIVVWSHNLHSGDSRATDMATAGRTSLGQLVRERYGADAVLIGVTTDSKIKGRVISHARARRDPPKFAPRR